MLSRNPYKLATDIYGIGFNTADRIAEKLGFDKSAPARAEAGILYVFNQLSNEGHVYYPYELLIEKCKEILEVDRAVITEAIDHITREGKIAIEDLGQDFDKFEANQKASILHNFILLKRALPTIWAAYLFHKKIFTRSLRTKPFKGCRKKSI